MKEKDLRSTKTDTRETSRREFLKTGTAVAGAAVIGSAVKASSLSAQTPPIVKLTPGNPINLRDWARIYAYMAWEEEKNNNRDYREEFEKDPRKATKSIIDQINAKIPEPSEHIHFGRIQKLFNAKGPPGASDGDVGKICKGNMRNYKLMPRMCS